jgi:putative DNA primase/helicase
VDKRRDLLAAASTMPGLACLPGDFDRDPWLLNCANGLLDLRTGRLRPHDPAAMCSKLAGAAYEPEAKCPGWERFLAEVFDGDEALILYVQLAVGYCLTGSTAEDCFFLCHGGGRNGKSTFLRVLRDLFGDYAAHTDFATLTIERERQAAIRNDLARLAGARLVTAIETSEGVRFAEGVVKALTGGDPVTARFLHKEFFEFDPQFKLWLGCNHKPRVRDTSEAFWRRVRLLPFEVQFSGNRERNREELLAELRAELPGILAWAVCGCLAWQEVGRLPLPDRVRAATEGYRVEEDVLSQFLADSCLTGPGLEVGASDLYQAYCEWCAANGEHPLSQTRFGRALGEKGFAKARTRTARWEYRGLGLLADDD